MRTLHPPSGGARPADTVSLGDESTLFLAPLAHETARRHLEEFPEERERYGAAGFEWCAHDMQYVLWWAALDAEGAAGLLLGKVQWLAGILRARDYPVERLARSLELAAEAVEQARPRGAEQITAVLRETAAAVAH